MALFRLFKTLRFRLTLLYVIIFGIVQTAMALLMNLGREQYLRKDFDTTLVERANTLVDDIIRQNQQVPETQRLDSLIQLVNSSATPGWYIEIRLQDSEGRIIKSGGLRLFDLPLSETALGASAHQSPVLESFSASWEGGSDRQSAEMRLLTAHCNTPRLGSFYLQVARDMEPFKKLLSEFRQTTFLFLGIGLAAAGIASWLLTRQSFAPIREIVLQAQQIGAQQLDRRITAPASDADVGDMVDVINNMLDRLEATFASQDRLLSDVAHELKTPIAILRAEAQRLGRKVATFDDHARFARDVSQEMARMGDIIDSFLAFSLPDKDRSDAVQEDVPIADLILDAVRHCLPVAKSREIRLVPKLPVADNGAPELTVRGHANLLRIMVENLVRNAKRYSPTHTTVEIEAATVGDRVEIRVVDNGIGIPNAELEKIFERGYRVVHEGRNIKGAGLGLSIAQSIARLHQGSIIAMNRPEGGCIFVISLPLARPAHAEPESP